MIYYNPKNGGFYKPGVNIAEDADFSGYVELSDAEHAELMANQGVNGQMIGLVNGRPALIPQPSGPAPDVQDKLNQNQKARLIANAYAAASPYQAAVDMDESTPAERENLKTWKKYLIAVNRVDLSQYRGIPAVWPAIPVMSADNPGFSSGAKGTTVVS